MKIFSLVLSLIYVITANAGTTGIVQSSQFHSVYGTTVAELYVRRTGLPIQVLSVRDTSYVTRYTQEAVQSLIEQTPKSDKAIGIDVSMLGISTVDFSNVEVNGLAIYAARKAFPARKNVYVISDYSNFSRLRFKWIEQVAEVEEFKVRTTSEFKGILKELQSQPRGTIVLNTTVLIDEWNKLVHYGDIEHIFIQSKPAHTEVGICRRGFKTTFAFGPSIEDTVKIMLGEKPGHISSCVNISRAYNKPVYLENIGGFDVVK